MLKEKRQQDSTGLISLIFGILAILLNLIGFANSLAGLFGFIFMIIAGILALIQLNRSVNNLAIAGLLLAIGSVILFMMSAVSGAVIIREAEEKPDIRFGEDGKIIYCDMTATANGKDYYSCDRACQDTCRNKGFSRTSGTGSNGPNGTCYCTCNGCPENW